MILNIRLYEYKDLESELDFYNEGKVRSKYYKPKEKIFAFKHSWVWILQLLINLGAIIVYLMQEKTIGLYQMWIPLQCLIFTALMCFFISEYLEQGRRLKIKEHIIADIKQRASSVALTPKDYSESVVEFGTTKRKLSIREQTMRDKNDDQLSLVDADFAKLNVACDTYSMCFKALHRQSAVDMRLIPNDWQRALQSAIFIFVIQILLIIMLTVALFSEDEGVLPPVSMKLLVARFICSLLMHMTTEGDVR